MDDAHERAMLDLCERFFAAVTAGDLDAVRAMYAPDAVIWHNNDGAEQSVEENLRVLRWVTSNVAGFRYEDVRRTATADGFIEQHVLRGRAERQRAARRGVHLCTVGDGITRLDESGSARSQRSWRDRDDRRPPAHDRGEQRGADARNGQWHRLRRAIYRWSHASWMHARRATRIVARMPARPVSRSDEARDSSPEPRERSLESCCSVAAKSVRSDLPDAVHVPNTWIVSRSSPTLWM